MSVIEEAIDDDSLRQSMGSPNSMMEAPQDKSTPRVSVLMTIFNAEAHLKEAIDSIITQAFSDWELIAVDDGSTDQSTEILSTYDDPRVRIFVFPENIGRTPALRYAFERARGEYIAVLDADDVALPERLGREVEFLDNHADVVLVSSWIQIVDERGLIIGTSEPRMNSKELHDSLGWANPTAHSAMMYRSDAASKVGGYPEEFAYAQDRELVVALAQYGKLAIIKEFLCQWRISPKGMTSSRENRLLNAYENLMSWRYALRLLPLSARARSLNRLATARAEIRYGLVLLMDKTDFSGFAQILKGFSRCPMVIWQNGPVRRCFGQKNEIFWWKRRNSPD